MAMVDIFVVHDENWLKQCVSLGAKKRHTLVGVKITPELAKIMLQRNHDNRPIRARSVRVLTHSMVAGDWVSTGDTIKFDTDGNLIDGQHRLEGVVASGKTLYFDIAFGVSPAAFDRIDCGNPRGPAALLAMVGGTNNMITAGAARVLLAIERKSYSLAARAEITHHEIVMAVQDRESLQEAANLADRLRKALGRSGSPGGVAAGFYLISRKYSLKSEFFETLQSGVGLSATSPVLQLRTRLMKSGKYRGTMDPIEAAAGVVKAYNLWRKDTPCRHLLWRMAHEDFPKVL